MLFFASHRSSFSPVLGWCMFRLKFSQMLQTIVRPLSNWWTRTLTYQKIIIRPDRYKHLGIGNVSHKRSVSSLWNFRVTILKCICALQWYYLNPRPAGVFSRTRPAGGGGQILPPCLTPELIGAARRARRRSKALNEKIPMHIKNFI